MTSTRTVASIHRARAHVLRGTLVGFGVVFAATTAAIASVCYIDVSRHCSADWTEPNDECPDSILNDPWTTHAISTTGDGLDNYTSQSCLLYIRPWVPVPESDCLPSHPAFWYGHDDTLTGSPCNGGGGGGES